MDSNDISNASKILKSLCVGAKIEGINFYGLKILLSENDTNSKRINGQVYINIESEFCLFASMPTTIPSHNQLPELEWAEASKLICELRLKEIIDISVHHMSPHLLLTFDTGEVLFIWGYHERYESWQVGVMKDSIEEESWEVIACPNNTLAYIGPEDIVGVI
ncbi:MULTISPECIES: hypothetical protein [unclassified Bacillus (in: firmicutes)]|uniref:hypothetical protein n=1 Tax=unclassified Bacillus (in: firmicutes) TaxID=185979 RepID=UPI001BECA5AB|nr:MULTISPECIES: hypothetical protein [unclassified Bacillus (in: firmicutes)]MBT2640459.1 hypothetical protein [Bacillus sp. ISL-39]MBT2663385.1 hypothetical protein [Bacillus sp. ISL-45]